MEELIQTLKQQIIEVLNLDDITCEDIDNDAPLFGEGLGLDSIDALELIVVICHEYCSLDNEQCHEQDVDGYQLDNRSFHLYCC